MDLNVSVRDPDAPLLAREDAADVHLDLRPRVGGGYVAIVLAAIASSALLATVAGRLAEIEEQTSAAVLLLVPALLVTYLVRPGEHAIATRMLAGVRVLGLLGAVAAFAGAALIGVTEVRTTSSSPTTERIDCTPVTERIGPGAAGRTALRDLDCSLVRPPAPVRRASADAANRLRALVWVAGIAAGVLAAGWLCAAVATWRARRRRDESHPNPPTVEVL